MPSGIMLKTKIPQYLEGKRISPRLFSHLCSFLIRQFKNRLVFFSYHAYIQRTKLNFRCPVQKCERFFILKLINILIKTCHKQKYRKILSHIYLKQADKLFHCIITYSLVYCHKNSLMLLFNLFKHPRHCHI